MLKYFCAAQSNLLLVHTRVCGEHPGCIPFLAADDITEAQELHVSYGYPGFDLVQAMASAASEYLLFFEGLNEARSGKPVLVDVWLCRFGAAKTISFIGNDFAELSLERKVMKHTNKTAGVTQYYRATLIQ